MYRKGLVANRACTSAWRKKNSSCYFVHFILKAGVALLGELFKWYMHDFVCFSEFVFQKTLSFFLILIAVNGRWSQWGEWCKCSKTCGTGNQNRKRTCSNPPPQHGGKQCKGPSEQTKSCLLKQCPG